MKICVYAICKNEEAFVDRWVDSMSEADEIVVLDTGSTDRTVERLRQRNVSVTLETISPWRFDVARNRALECVPADTDVCVCTDLDEILEAGWRAALERQWTPETKRAHYRYTWNFNPDGSEGTVFWTDKIHTRHDFRWILPVHEVLDYLPGGNYRITTLQGVQLNHRPDPQKSRAQYLPLLELAAAESPLDDRTIHYLGREYMFNKRWEKSIETLLRHLALPSATWPDERCASMRFIARNWRALQNPDEAKRWLHRAIAEAPHLREPYIEFAALLYDEQNWPGVLFLTESALGICERSMTYINEPASWGPKPYDLASLACYHLGLYEKALLYVDEAIRLCPTEERLRANRVYFTEKSNLACPSQPVAPNNKS